MEWLLQRLSDNNKGDTVQIVERYIEDIRIANKQYRLEYNAVYDIINYCAHITKREFEKAISSLYVVETDSAKIKWINTRRRVYI
jgi:hypothetical protein